MKRLLSAVMLAGFLAGCMPTVGNKNLSMALVQENVKAGVTTKQGLLDSLGKPFTVSIVTGKTAIPPSVPPTIPFNQVKEIWQYMKMSREGMMSMGMTTVSFYLDGNGIVLDYTMTETQNQ